MSEAASESPWYDGLRVTRRIDRMRFGKDQERYDEHQYDDAQLDYRPSEGKLLLWIAIEADSETGTTRDVDGDRAKDLIIMRGIHNLYIEGGYVAADGFVEAEPHTGVYLLEHWTQWRKHEDSDD